MSEIPRAKPPLFELPSESRLALPKMRIFKSRVMEPTIIREIRKTRPEDQYMALLPDQATWRFDFDTSGSVYIKTVLRKTLFYSPPTQTHSIYAIDVSNNGDVMGIGYCIRPAVSSFDREQYPCVGDTQTNAPFLQQGLNLRRLIVLDAASKEIYGETLHSGVFRENNPDDPATKTWETLVRTGLAIKTATGYEFL